MSDSAATQDLQDHQHSTVRLLARLDSRWRTTGVPRRERQQLLAEVGADLSAMYEVSGVADPQQLLGTDPDTFADDVAAARGLTRPASRYGQLLGWAAIGAAVAIPTLVTLLLTVLSGMANTDEMPQTTANPGPTVVYVESTTADYVIVFGLYALMGVLFIALVIGAVSYGLRGDSRVKATAARMAVLMPLSAAFSVPAAMGFANVSNYSLSLSVVAFEAFLLIAPTFLAVIGARFWALRHCGSAGPWLVLRTPASSTSGPIQGASCPRKATASGRFRKP